MKDKKHQQKKINAMIQFCSELLKISVRWIYSSLENDVAAIFHLESEEDYYIIVNENITEYGLTKEEVLLSIAHECRHVQQYCKRRDWFLESKSNYDILFCEIELDAYAFQNAMAEFIYSSKLVIANAFPEIKLKSDKILETMKGKTPPTL